MTCQRVRAILSVGGWTGSGYFSSAVATDANRTAFAKAIMDVVSQYNLDGVEFECALHSMIHIVQLLTNP